MYIFFFFFFSSRRRHTRSLRDWSSDVCSSDLELRFDTLTIKPMSDPNNLFPQVLGREIGDRIRIVRRPPGGGTITRDVFIRGIEHSVDARAREWVTTW